MNNKNTAIFTAVLLTTMGVFITDAPELEARGRGGGGGRDFGGARENFEHAPFEHAPMENRDFDHHFDNYNFENRNLENRNFDNRAFENRSLDQGRFRDAPSEGDIQQFLRPTTSRDNLRQFMRQPNASALSATNVGRLGAQDFAQREMVANQTAHRVSNAVRNNLPGVNGLFNQNFFRDHNFYPYYYRNGMNWWAASNWGALAGWMAWDNVAPLYYDSSGTASTVPVGSSTPSDSQTSASFPSDEASPATTTASSDTANGNWLSLGVFVLGQDEQQLANSNMFLQLALNKDGTIAGTYYNTSSNQTFLVDGEVDQQTQQAAWKLTDHDNATLMKTGLYNLTQAQTPVTVQFADGTMQMWQMVRMSQ